MTDWRIVPTDDGVTTPAWPTVEHLHVGHQGDRRTIRRKILGIPAGRTVAEAYLVGKRSRRLTRPALFSKHITTSYIAGRGKIEVIGPDTFVEFELRGIDTSKCYPSAWFDCDVILDNGAPYTACAGRIRALRNANRIAEVGSVVVTPSTFAITDAQEIQLAAVVYDDNGVLMSEPVVWSSSAPSVATVNAATGLVTGQSEGNVIISATVDGLAGISTGVLTFAYEADSIEIVGGDFAVFNGQTIQLTAIVRSGVTVLPDRPLTWSSSNPAAMTVHPTTGLVTGVSTGTSTITVSTPGAGAAIITDTALGNSLQQYTAVQIDTDGHSLMARSGVGGNPWLTHTEQIKGMLGATVNITEWAVNGRTITEMRDQLAGQARPAQPAGTLKLRISTETINAWLLAGLPIETVWSQIEEYCLAVAALGYYDRHYWIAGTPGGYNGLQDLNELFNQRLRNNVTLNVHGANPIGTSLGVTVIGLDLEPKFAQGGIKRGTHACDPWVAPDVTNEGGMADYEMSHNYDWSGVHWSSNAHSLCARVVAEVLNDTLAMPLITATGFQLEVRNAANAFIVTAGTVINAERGVPLVLRFRSLVGAVVTPTLHASAWRSDANGDAANDLSTYVDDPGLLVYYPRTDAGTITVRCGRVTQVYTINWTGGTQLPTPHVQRMVKGWNGYFNSKNNQTTNHRYIFDFERGAARIATTSGFVVGERVVSVTSEIGGLVLTVPGGSVGPILRSRCLTSFAYPPGSSPRTLYYLEFDSASAKLRSPLSALNDLVADFDLWATGEFTNATGAAPILPVKIHNAGDTQILAIDTSQTGWRMYRKTGALDGYSTAVGDRLTSPDERSVKLWKYHSAVDGFSISRVEVEGGVGETSWVNVNPNFTAEDLYLSIGGVSYMELDSLAAGRNLPHDGEWYHENTAFIWGSN